MWRTTVAAVSSVLLFGMASGEQGPIIGTIVLQPPQGTTPLEHFRPTTGPTQPLLSGRITDWNDAPMAGRHLTFNNRSTGFLLRMDENGAFVCPPASNMGHIAGSVTIARFPTTPEPQVRAPVGKLPGGWLIPTSAARLIHYTSCLSCTGGEASTTLHGRW